MHRVSATIGLTSMLLATVCWGDSLSDIYELALQNDPQLRA
ncbi:hypothetical protein LCGC14_1680810, partial [marine sediment metagenome]